VNFIRPVLRILGHHFGGVRGKVSGKDRTPDYAFFPDKESMNQAEARPKEYYYRRAVAVGEYHRRTLGIIKVGHSGSDS
jgi:hypothetical protein